MTKFNIGDEVKFVGKRFNDSQFYSERDGIPRHLIQHGNYFDNNKDCYAKELPKIVEKYDKFYIVKFKGSIGDAQDFLQLGFTEDSLIPCKIKNWRKRICQK